MRLVVINPFCEKGNFNLKHHVGDILEVGEERGLLLISKGLASEVSEKQPSEEPEETKSDEAEEVKHDEVSEAQTTDMELFAEEPKKKGRKK